ncbi:MAG: hypothetical protein RSC76_03720 [Oscillospiraceae bacterium]
MKEEKKATVQEEGKLEKLSGEELKAVSGGGGWGEVDRSCCSHYLPVCGNFPTDHNCCAGCNNNMRLNYNMMEFERYGDYSHDLPPICMVAGKLSKGDPLFCSPL